MEGVVGLFKVVILQIGCKLKAVSNEQELCLFSLISLQALHMLKQSLEDNL